MDDARTRAQRVRQARTERGLTQEGLAAAIGVTRSTVRAWETQGRLPRPDTMVAVCRVLYVSMDYLAGLSDNPHPPWHPNGDGGTPPTAVATNGWTVAMTRSERARGHARALCAHAAVLVARRHAIEEAFAGPETTTARAP